MSPAAPERRRRRIAGLAVAVALCGISPLPAQSAAGMLQTKHNLAVTGPGPIQALTETRVCIFCHTPHNAAGQADDDNEDDDEDDDEE